MTSDVLYIDDEENNRLVVQRLLKRVRPDIQLHTATTGADGTRMAVASQPALILLDNRLPDASGEEVLRELAANPATAAIPVIMLSGDAGERIANELLAAGAMDFLAKPFDINQLLDIIKRFIT